MPSLKPETLRAYVLLTTNEDHPASELSYRSELTDKDGTPCGDDYTEPEHIRFCIIRKHPEGHEQEVGFSVAYEFGEHSRGHWEREFIDSMVAYVQKAFVQKKAEFERLRESVAAAGFTV